MTLIQDKSNIATKMIIGSKSILTEENKLTMIFYVNIIIIVIIVVIIIVIESIVYFTRHGVPVAHTLTTLFISYHA